MKEPDLDKSWNLPDEFAEQRIKRIMEHQKILAKDEPKPQAAPAPAPTPSKATPSASSSPEKEMLVYLSARADDKLLGAIFIDSQSTIEDVIQQINEELDDIPQQFTISRHNGSLAIPISKKQWSKKTLVHFRDEQDAIIVVPVN
ncbi:unnamed protein product [Umbelopsis ramanniana]